MTKIQRDLFGNKISEDTVEYGINMIRTKIAGESSDLLIHIRKKVENPFRDITMEMQKQFLQYLSLTTLKNECRSRGIKGYSGKKKSELTDLIIMNLSSEELENFFFQISEKVTRLKKFKTLEQKRYRKQANYIMQSDDLLKSDFDNWDAWYTKIEVLIELKRYEEALINANKAVEYCDPYFLTFKAKIYKELQNEDKELECYTKLIEDDHYPEAQLKKALILIKRREYDEAIILLDGLQGCESHDTIFPIALFHKARIRAAQGKKVKTLRTLKAAMGVSAVFSSHGIGGSVYPSDITAWVEESPEFEKFRELSIFKFILSFDWGTDCVIEFTTRHFF